MHLDWFHERRRQRIEKDPLVVGLERIKHGVRTFTPRKEISGDRRRRRLRTFGVPYPIKHNPIEFPTKRWEWEWERAVKKAELYLEANPWVTTSHRNRRRERAWEAALV